MAFLLFEFAITVVMLRGLKFQSSSFREFVKNPSEANWLIIYEKLGSNIPRSILKDFDQEA